MRHLKKKNCSDFTFLIQQIAQSNKPPYLTISLSIFTENNEAYVSQDTSVKSKA